MFFRGEYKVKLSSTGQMTLPRRFLSMLYNDATHSEVTLVFVRSPDRNVFEIEHPYIVEGWRSMEEYQAEIKNYSDQFPCLASSDNMYDLVQGQAELFEVPVSPCGEVNLPEPMKDFLRVNGCAETMCLVGNGSTFEMMSQKVNDEVSYSLEKWLNAEMIKQGVYDPLELLGI